MRRVCAKCSVAVEAAAAVTGDGDAADPTCEMCGSAMRAPTAFDCARLGLLPEFQEIVDTVRRPTLGRSFPRNNSAR